MVIPGQSSRLSSWERLLRGLQEHGMYRCVAAFTVGAFLVLYLFSSSDRLDYEKLYHHEDYHHVFRDGSSNRCNDVSDPGANNTSWKCFCSDPRLPLDRKAVKGWKKQHAKLIRLAQHKGRKTEELDFCMVGDSITERWMGTKRLSTEAIPDHAELFARHFDKSSGASLQGLALGSSGDTSPNLLWHFNNGMLPDRLQPKVWVILIGTNDLGITRCSKSNTLAGILNVVQYLHTKRPDAQILLHGLLPRATDSSSMSDYRLGLEWDRILWINQELRRFCALHDEWHYMEAGGVFLHRELGGHDTHGRLQINSTLMRDKLHPTLEGYKLWALKLAAKIVQIIG